MTTIIGLIVTHLLYLLSLYLSSYTVEVDIIEIKYFKVFTRYVKGLLSYLLLPIAQMHSVRFPVSFCKGMVIMHPLRGPKGRGVVPMGATQQVHVHEMGHKKMTNMVP